MEMLLSEIERLGIKSHLLGYFGGKTWGGGAVSRLNAFNDQVKWEVVYPPFEVQGEAKNTDIEQCILLAKAMAAKLI